MSQFIVAEISKNWLDGRGISETPLLCQQFEIVIARNLARGYRLHSFQLHRFVMANVAGADVMNETIIAVFEKQSEQSEQ